MEAKDYSISGLYYRYGKTSDAEIIKNLDRIKLVIKKYKDYVEIPSETLKRIIESPRKVAWNFDFNDNEVKHTPIVGLKEFKNITYLAKSSSRFFLKPDIGEVFDQLGWEYTLDQKIKAICLNSDYELLPDTDGEHFLMTATLLIEE